jgi:nucleoside-diphosphate-sugar epimerase
MRVFVTGGSGFIGSAVVPELLDHGHQVVGLARSDSSAAALRAAGAEVRRGDLVDLAALRAGAAEADAVVHLAFIHDDFSDMAPALAADRAAIETFVDALAGTGKALAVAGGTLGLTGDGRTATEADGLDGPRHPRAAHADLVLRTDGVRGSVVRLSPTVHGAGDHGFVAALVGVARERGHSGYAGDGSGRWNAVHRSDAARVFRLAIESAPAGSVLHAVGEEAVTHREIAELIGAGLGVPVGPAEVGEMSWIGPMFALDAPASSARTRELLGWEPTGPTLPEDLVADGPYFS